MKIILDTREPPNVYTQIATHPLLGIPELAMLPCGDIILDDIIVERKEPSDLLNSIKDGRLFNQCSEMRAGWEWAYLLITGQMTWGFDGKITGTGWNFRSIEGALLQCQELGVGVVHAQDSSDLATSLAWLVSRRRSKLLPISPRRIGVPMPLSNEILASLPGIGTERAHDLLLEKGSLLDALLCLLDPACKVKGIAGKTKRNIRNLFNLAENQTLEVVTDDK
jgi:ERCC4-type nuclease